MQKLKSLLETHPVKSSSKSSIFKTTGTSIMQKPQTQSQLQLRSQVTTEDKIKTAEITKSTNRDFGIWGAGQNDSLLCAKRYF